jgi:iron complex transport system permease protein
MTRADRNGLRLNVMLAVLIAALAIGSLMVGPASLTPRAALAGLLDGEGAAGIVVRDIGLPPPVLGFFSGATLGRAGAAVHGLRRNPLA